MTAPAHGIERLIWFVNARIRQLDLSKREVARRGGPNPDTLAKIRDRDAGTPSVETLLRLDQSLGWHAGSSAVTMLGGAPLSLNAVGARAGRPRAQSPARPVSAGEIQHRLAAQLDDEIARLQATRDAFDLRIAALRTVADRFAAELVPPDQLAEYQIAYKASTRAGRPRKSAAG